MFITLRSHLQDVFIFRVMFFLIMLTINSPFGYAQYFTGPVASGTGGAGRAAVEDGEQFFHNPASVAHAAQSSSSIIYYDGHLAEDERDRTLGVTLTDSNDDNFFAGAFGYINRKRSFQFLPSIEENYYNFSASKFIWPQLALGVGVTFLQTKINEQDPNFILKSEYKQWDFNAGLHYNPNPDLGMAVVFYNILPRDEEVPQYIQNQDVVALGFYYIAFDFLRTRADVSQQLSNNPDGDLRFQLGFETKQATFFVARLGYEDDQLSERKYGTLGLGFNGPRLKVDYFYRKNMDDNEGALHGVDFRLPFW